jgi:probable HAF family extracellular repeat protein
MFYDGTTLHDLGTLGGVQSHLSALNDSGQVVGQSHYYEGEADWHGFSWTQAGGMVDLDVLVGRDASPTAVNNSGQVIGVYRPPPLYLRHAFVWTQAGGMIDLGENTEAFDINDSGQVVGVFVAGDGFPHPFLWTAADGMVDLGHTHGGRPITINDSGQVLVGGSGNSLNSTPTRAYVWTSAGGMVSLGGLTNVAQALTTNPIFMNNSGQVVGCSRAGDGLMHFFSWTAAGGMVDLGVYSGIWGDLRCNRGVVGLSDSGHVLLNSQVSQSPDIRRASVWTEAGGMVALGDLGGNLPKGATAAAINDSGQVVGYSKWFDGVHNINHAFSWSPNGGMVDLNDVVPVGTSLLAEGEAVSNAGIIVASGHVLEPNISNTEVGTDVTVSPPITGEPAGTVLVTFDNVQTAGNTSATASATGPASPAGFKLTDPPLYYEIATTAEFAGSIRICLGWTEGQVFNEANVGIFHYEGGNWVDITDASSVDPVNNIVCGTSNSLSPFAVFEVQYQFTGFFPPVDNLPTVNSVKAGSAVPVKFSLSGTQGLDVFAAGYPRAQLVQCTTGAPLDEIEEVSSAGSSDLQYNASSDTYHYTWKTNAAWANSCRELQIRFNDGGLYTARFSMR